MMQQYAGCKEFISVYRVGTLQLHRFSARTKLLKRAPRAVCGQLFSSVEKLLACVLGEEMR